MLISGGWHYLSEDETLPKPIGDLIWGTVGNRKERTYVEAKKSTHRAPEFTP